MSSGYPSPPSLADAGAAALAAGDAAGAETLFRRALDADPATLAALDGLTVLAVRAGQFAVAARLAGQAARAAPRDAARRREQGALLLTAGERAAAAAALAGALALDPGDGRAVHNFGKAQGEAMRTACWLDRAARRLGGDFAAQDGAARAWAFAGQADRAVVIYRRVLALAPDRGETWRHFGLALAAAERFAAAAAAHRRCLILRPDHVGAANDGGVARHRLGDLAGAERSFRTALAIAPDYAEAWWNLSHVLLATERFRRGFAAFEWRRQTPGYAGLAIPTLAPDWIGDVRPGDRLWVMPEQGLGDSLQFLRFLPAVAARVGAVHLTLPRPLCGLARRSLPGNVTVSPDPPDRADRQCPLQSLPARLGLDRLPGAGGYLAADPDRIARWRTRLGPRLRPRVGLAWAGNPQNPIDRARSIPAVLLAPLLAVDGIDWFSLQIDQPAPPGLIDLTAEIADFDDTAALIASFDLTIAVDSAVAHVAGGLGRPVWVALSWLADWRWLLDRADNPWYASARLFRQPSPGDWPRSLDGIAAALRQWRHTFGGGS